MKTIFNKIGILGLVAFAFLNGFSSCDDADYDVIENAVYLANAEGVAKSEQIIADDNSVFVNVTARSARPTNKDVTTSMIVDQNFLAEYNKRYNTDYKILPNDYFVFANNKAIIPSGKAGANPLDIEIKPLSSEMSKSGFTYAVPISIASADGLPIMKSSSSYLFAVSPIPMADVPMFQRGNSMVLGMQRDYSLTNWTVEFLFKISRLGAGIGVDNNQILFTADDIFLRFGDTKITGRTFQVKTMDSEFTSSTEFDANKWYHIAVVNDGQNVILYVNGIENARMASPGIAVNLLKDRFRFCGESDKDKYMVSKVWGSELRFWTIARTAEQIKNNIYGVDPASPGLEAYWRLNEGTGRDFEDVTGHGHAGWGEEALSGSGIVTEWYLDERIEVGR